MVSQDIPYNVNLAALITTAVLSSIFVAARTVARWLKEHAFVAEDFFSWLSLAAHLTQVGLYLGVLQIIYEVQAFGEGKPVNDPNYMRNGSRMMRHLFAIQLCFWITLYAVKISLLFLFKRLTLGLPLYQKIWTAVLAFTVLCFVGCVVSEFTSCQPLSSYFDFGQCNKYRDAKAQAASLYYSLAVDLITDILIMAIPIRLLWNLQISRVEKICIGIAMCVGVITMICAIVRASSLGMFAKAGQIPISWLALWASIECCIAIVVNCLPSFAIVLRRQIVSMKSRNESHRESRSQNMKLSQKKNQLRSQSVLLQDLQSLEGGERRKRSHGDGSDTHEEYANSSRTELAR